MVLDPTASFIIIIIISFFLSVIEWNTCVKCPLDQFKPSS